MPRTVRVVNRTRDLVLAERAELADNIITRFFGLMGRRDVSPGGGLVLKPGGAIHMFFMRIPLDVVHLDKRGRVTDVLRGIKPWRMGPLFVGSGPTVELVAGGAGPTQPGDEIVVEGLGRSA